jgi:hypothetical protein
MISVRSLVELHDGATAAKASLADNLFDAVLYERNGVYRRLRDACLLAGTTFSSMHNDLTHDYRSYPLLSLPTILEKNVVPYVDNVSPLRRVLRRRPELAVELSFMTEHFQRNHVFHEGLHCLLRAPLFASGASLGNEAMLHLISEAVSLSVFDFAALEATDKGQLLGCMFNKIPVVTQSLDIFRRAIQTWGPESTSSLYAAACVCCLALVDKHDVTPILLETATGVPVGEDIEISMQVRDAAFWIHAPFLDHTQDIYFELVGCARPNRGAALQFISGAQFRHSLDRAILTVGPVISMPAEVQ